MTDEIEQLMTGRLEMDVFLRKLKDSLSLQHELDSLLPKEAVNNFDHMLWKRISYSTFKQTDFSIYGTIKLLAKMDGSIGDNLNIFGTISTIFCFVYPDIQITDSYSEAFSIYLKACNDCFDGPEVTQTVDEIIQKSLLQKTKTGKIRFAKELIKETFHVTENVKPRWLQGPEWPMGKYSPMEFLRKVRHREAVHYQFRDVDTGELREIIQYF